MSTKAPKKKRIPLDKIDPRDAARTAARQRVRTDQKDQGPVTFNSSV